MCAHLSNIKLSYSDLFLSNDRKILLGHPVWYQVIEIMITLMWVCFHWIRYRNILWIVFCNKILNVLIVLFEIVTFESSLLNCLFTDDNIYATLLHLLSVASHFCCKQHYCGLEYNDKVIISVLALSTSYTKGLRSGWKHIYM